MNGALAAGLWGALGGSALLIGAAIGWFAPLPQRAIAIVMAFGAGVLISALSFELMDEAWSAAGAMPVVLGFVGGAILFTGLNRLLAMWGARHRKRSSPHVRSGDGESADGGALALGALLDGIPESVVIGVSLLHGGAVGLVTVIAVFLSNVPEGLSSAAGMRREGRSLTFVFGLWSTIVLASGAAAAIGFVVMDGADPAATAAIQALAAGAILAMIADTMIPEAFAESHDWTGLAAVAGFLAAFLMSKTAGG